MEAKEVPKIISVASIKGGVGKSTTCLILAKLLAQKHKVLLIDMDTQASITSYYNKQLKEHNVNVASINVYKILKDEIRIDNAIVSVEGNIDIIPSYYTLQDFVEDCWDSNTITFQEAKFFLKDAMQGLTRVYDYILIDNPPSLDIFLVNSLFISDYVIVPVVCELWTVESLELIYDKVYDRLKLVIPIYTIATKFRKRSTYERLYNELDKRSNLLGFVSERESLNRSIFSKIDFDMTCDYVSEYQTIWNNFISKSRIMA
ncbi:AAA family ATPase (plasmid) [Borrelia sp. A-FGy1]|uniref:ParA family protein n=1 Tax=Borrelia sp. A-FGy1 TaxID=2608247 RepID=UPI0015F3DE07|nr:ParA family protein [Borrelia sp. A-FGy1]QMU99789.1 AAA family ATPase [Borrelia sp. A-FGy1]